MNVPVDHDSQPRQDLSLIKLLGGHRSALDASLPPLVFVLGWWLAGHSIPVGAVAAIVVGAVIAVWRLIKRHRPRAVVISLLAVIIAALVALYTGEAIDFFLTRLLTNAASALVFMASIAMRWPLLGIIVGTVLGQRTRWRQDPDLLRAYSRASWIWVGQYMIRVAVFFPLWWANLVVPLGIAQTILTWPLVAVCLLVSGWVLVRSLPAEHPGIHQPRTSRAANHAAP